MLCAMCDPLKKSDEFHLVTFNNSALDCHLWLYDYEQARDVIYRSKYGRESIHYSHHAARLAHAISSAIQVPWHQCAFTYVPTISEHVRIRGRDHARVLTAYVARHCGASVADLLIPTHEHAQAHAGRIQRGRNPHYLCTTSLKGKTILVFDDVATTRTTLEHSAVALKKAGAKEVMGITIAYRSLTHKINYSDSAHRAQHG